MRLLLDTHVAIWAVSETRKLPAAALEAIGDGENEVFVSLVSLWEIAIKHSLPPRRQLAMSAENALLHFEEAHFSLLPMSTRHIRAVQGVEGLHGDPFDRMLVAQALTETINFVTFDGALIGYHPLVMSF